jgi:hypothetical protein
LPVEKCVASDLPKPPDDTALGGRGSGWNRNFDRGNSPRGPLVSRVSACDGEFATIPSRPLLSRNCNRQY